MSLRRVGNTEVPRSLSVLKLLAAIFLVGLVPLSGCDDETINLVQRPENSPPRILLSGFDYDSIGVTRGPVTGPWVLPTDPDGAEDIAAVILNVGSMTLNSLIVRPDSAEAECVWAHYADMDTFNLMPHLPTTTFSIENLVLYGYRGIYAEGFDYHLLTAGGMSSHLDSTGPLVKGCYSGVDWQYYLERFGLYPPVMVPARDVHVTYADISVNDISITVYDQSGASDSATFPDARIVFTNPREDATLP